MPHNPAKAAASSDRQGVTLRRQLLISILPVTLVPLVIAGVLSWGVTNQQASERADAKLWGDAMLAADMTERLVGDAFAVPSSLAEDPLFINTARTSTRRW